MTKRLADNPQANFVPVYRSFEDPVPADAPTLDLVTIVNNYHDIVYLPIDRAKIAKMVDFVGRLATDTANAAGRPHKLSGGAGR